MANRRRASGQFVTPVECCPGTKTNNGGVGGGAPETRQNRKFRSNMGRYAPAFPSAVPDNDTSGGKPALVQYPG